MSDRPADWSAVGRDGDPTPGDPVVVRGGGQKYQNIASALARAAATLRQMNGGASSGSDSVVALLENCDEIADQLSTAQARYQTTGDALVTYAYTLDQIQSTTLQALMTANRARDSMEENTRLADQYARWASYADTPERAEEQARYLRLEATYRTAAGDDQTTIDQQKQIIDQAVADRDQAAQTAIAQIEDVTSSDGLNDSWWDDWGAKLVEWISTIAEAVASNAGILALVLCWVPVLGQALMAIAAVAGIVAAAANIVLAATGEKSWGEAIISIAFAALGCVGLGGTRGILGALRGGARLAKGGLPAFAAVFKTGGASVRTFAKTVKDLCAGARSLRAGGGSGTWTSLAEDYTEGAEGVVAQITPTSCVSASGEMLSNGAHTQVELIKTISDAKGMAFLGDLVRVLGRDSWAGKLPDDLRDIFGKGPVALSLKEYGQNAHAVVAEALDDGRILIKDPWPPGIGSSYILPIDTLDQFVSFAIYPK